VRTVVSQFAATIGGKPACSDCGRRPKRWSGGRWQSKCAVCHAEYVRDRRRGKVEVLLTPGEWEMVKAWRALEV